MKKIDARKEVETLGDGVKALEGRYIVCRVIRPFTAQSEIDGDGYMVFEEGDRIVVRLCSDENGTDFFAIVSLDAVISTPTAPMMREDFGGYEGNISGLDDSEMFEYKNFVFTAYDIYGEYTVPADMDFFRCFLDVCEKETEKLEKYITDSETYRKDVLAKDAREKYRLQSKIDYGVDYRIKWYEFLGILVLSWLTFIIILLLLPISNWLMDCNITPALITDTPVVGLLISLMGVRIMAKKNTYGKIFPGKVERLSRQKEALDAEYAIKAESLAKELDTAREIDGWCRPQNAIEVVR